MQELDPAAQDLRPCEREVWERLAPDDQGLVLRAWRVFVDEDGESPLWLGWSMQLAGVLPLGRAGLVAGRPRGPRQVGEGARHGRAHTRRLGQRGRIHCK